MFLAGLIWFDLGFRALSKILWPCGGEGSSGAFGFWLCFRSVTGRVGHAPSLSLAKTPKSLAAARPQYFFKRSGLIKINNFFFLGKAWVALIYLGTPWKGLMGKTGGREPDQI
jgi:hypothetical protein